ncbi:MAG: pyroglutamyl-peptidase I [Planctomycetes bacterium]|nr:pyroglutamyl-peptidase I [Planctomycetota bacterium]
MAEETTSFVSPEYPEPLIKKLLLSGFEPFGGSPVNSSWEAIENLPDEAPEGLEIESVQLPVEYDRSYELLKARIEEFDPDAIVCFGLAAGREFRIERRAENIDRTLSPDNAGVRRLNNPIDPEGERFLPSCLPLEDFRLALKAAELPVIFSDSAGNYVCNNIFYHLMNDDSARAKLRGFVHVPSPDPDFESGMPQDKIDLGVREILKSLLFVKTDSGEFEPRDPDK